MKKLLATALLFTLALAPLAGANVADAANAADFNPGRIIDDAVFYNKDSMSVQQIQDFLSSKVVTCDTNGTQPYYGTWNGVTYNGNILRGKVDSRFPAPYTCLKDYKENIATHENNVYDLSYKLYSQAFYQSAGISNLNTPSSSINGAISAAQIIYNEAQASGISPKVLLTLIQKESSLITDDWPWPNQYQTTTGYGCPDTSACNSQYFGFYNQVHSAALQFRSYANNPDNYNFGVGANSIAYNPNGACGTIRVNIVNQATANLYDYTPYTPNQAALNNLYGTGDSCSAYGNRNFWRIFTDWFGSTQSNDTSTAHVNGTLVLLNQAVYLVDNNKLRHIANPSVFDSYGYKWANIKKATYGDSQLPLDDPVSDVAPSTIYSTGDGNVYINDVVDGVIKKQWLSYSSFVALGYKWSDLKHYPASDIITASTPGVYTTTKHASGSIVKYNNAAYLIDGSSLRHILNPAAFDSYRFSWANLRMSTAADQALTVGPDLGIRQGTIAYIKTGLVLVDYDPQGMISRPIGPWECYDSTLHYTSQDWVAMDKSFLADRSGSLFTCNY